MALLEIVWDKGATIVLVRAVKMVLDMSTPQ